MKSSTTATPGSAFRSPASIAGLKRFNPTRYAALQFPNPNPDEACAAGGRGKAAPVKSTQEEGLRWDMYSQVAAPLRSDLPNRPLASLKVERGSDEPGQRKHHLYQRHSSQMRLAGGGPVYDGYVIKNFNSPAKLSRCGPTPKATRAKSSRRSMSP